MALGTRIPPFKLPDLEGSCVHLKIHNRSSAPRCVHLPHCPFAQHVRHGFSRFAKEYQERGLVVFAVNSNDEQAFPEDGLGGMKEEAAQAGYTFPYLRDESQQVAQAFRAACTPDLFLFDRDRRLAYRGQFDDSRPLNASRSTAPICEPPQMPYWPDTTRAGTAKAQTSAAHQVEAGERARLFQEQTMIRGRRIHRRLPIRKGSHMSLRRALALIVLVLFPVTAFAADVSGTWTATFDTQVGQQSYTYTFVVKGTQLTGRAKSANGDVEIHGRQVDGTPSAYREPEVQDMDLRMCTRARWIQIRNQVHATVAEIIMAGSSRNFTVSAGHRGA